MTTTIPLAGIGIALASHSNKDPNNGHYDQWSRPKKLVDYGIQKVVHEDVIPFIDQGATTIIMDMPGGKKNIVGKYGYRAWEQRSRWPFRKGRREIKEMELTIKTLASMDRIEEVMLYQGCLEAPEMEKIKRRQLFERAALIPLKPFLTNPKVSFIFDAANSTKIDTFDHRVNRFLGWLDYVVGGARIYREALPRNETQYGQPSFIKINTYRQLTNLSPQAFTAPIHFYYDDLRMVGVIPIPGDETRHKNSLAHWCAYCFSKGYKFSVAVHVLKGENMTLAELRDAAQEIYNKEMK